METPAKRRPRTRRRIAAGLWMLSVATLIFHGQVGLGMEEPPHAQLPSYSGREHPVFRTVGSLAGIPGRPAALHFLPDGARALAIERLDRKTADIWLLSPPDGSGGIVRTPNAVIPRPLLPDGMQGSQVAWRSGEANGVAWFLCAGTGAERNVDLYLGSTAGAWIRLTDDSANDIMPQWNPRGDAAIFVSGRMGTADLYLFRHLDHWIEGGCDPRSRPRLERLTTGEGDELFPAWSPDGRYVAYTSWDVGPNETALRLNDGITVLQVEPKIGRPVRITHDESTAEFQPSWSPDMSLIAYYVQNDDVYHDQETAADHEVHLTVSVIQYDRRSGVVIGGKRLRGATRYLASSVRREQGHGPVWLPEDVPAILAVTSDNEDGDRLCRLSVSRWLAPGSGFRSEIDPGLPAAVGPYCIGPGGEMALAVPGAGDWEIRATRLAPVGPVGPEERPVPREFADCPCDHRAASAQGHPWFLASALAGLLAVFGVLSLWLAR